MKYAYLVSGSEDGSLGIYTSIARAYSRAVQYVQTDDSVLPPTVTLSELKHRFNVMGQMNECIESENGYGTATIELFLVNQ